MCAALIHPFSFVRRFVSEILYFQQFHILTQTKPNHLLAWTFPNIARNFSDCDAIKLFCPFTKQNSCTSTFLSPSLLCVWAKIVSLHIHIISAILHATRFVYWNQKFLLFFQNAIELCPKFHTGRTRAAWIGAKCMAKNTHTQKYNSWKRFTR